jgi:hypothetical protein
MTKKENQQDRYVIFKHLHVIKALAGNNVRDRFPEFVDSELRGYEYDAAYCDRTRQGKTRN